MTERLKALRDRLTQVSSFTVSDASERHPRVASEDAFVFPFHRHALAREGRAQSKVVSCTRPRALK